MASHRHRTNSITSPLPPSTSRVIADPSLDKVLHAACATIETPAFLLSESALRANLQILAHVRRMSGARILLALKAFASFRTFPILRSFLDGVCAGSLFEARLGREEFGKEVHTYGVAFSPHEIRAVIRYSDHLVFNSLSQLDRFGPLAKKLKPSLSLGIRVNPGVCARGMPFHQYNPCGRYSRFGILPTDIAKIPERVWRIIDGLHFHALCEQGADAFEEVLHAFTSKFHPYIQKVSWVNFGGGHHITKKGYDIPKLLSLIKDFQRAYPNITRVYLEPGEAVVLNAGYLIVTVEDIVWNEKPIAILDTSAESHIPDILFTRGEKNPYRPFVLGSVPLQRASHRYILAGTSCAAGDVIGEYGFSHPLCVGDRLVFTDMAHYSIVKTSNFCGVRTPSIFLLTTSGNIRTLRRFGYQSYRARL